MSAADEVVHRLDVRGCRPRWLRDFRWSSRCPAHEDHNPSLSIAVGDDGRVLVHCHAGCEPEAVVAALDLTMRDLFPSPPESQPLRMVMAVTPPTIRLRRLADYLADPDLLKPRPVVVPRLAWRERVTMLAGQEKLGKSTLAAAAVASLSSGSEFLSEKVEQGIALVVTIDEHVGETVRNLVRFAAQPERVYIATDTDLGTDRIASVAELVRQVVPDLTVIDSLWALTAGKVTDSGDAAAWAQSLLALTRIARESKSGLLLIHHARKSDGRYRDSSAIGAAVDAILEMLPGTDNTTREIKARGRWPMGDFNVRLNGNVADPEAVVWYSLDSGELPMSTRILAYITTNPGCSKAAIDKAVSGRHERVREELRVLVARSAVSEQRDGNRLTYLATTK